MRVSSCFIALVFFVDVQTILGVKYKFVNVVFRHGDRAPLNDDDEPFPTSPYLNSDFPPNGPAQLTNIGKKRAYDLGVYIRKQYGELLGDIYHPSVIIARSTNVDRTKMSLLATMAGIFPPAARQRWHPNLNWQPVVINYPQREDVLLHPYYCPQFVKELKIVADSPEVQQELSQYREMMKNLTEWSGKPIVLAKHCDGLYNGLMALYSMGLELPHWTSGVFPHGPLLNCTTLNYRVYSWNQRMKTLSGGMLLKNFTENMLAVAGGNWTSQPRMILLSGHEINLTSFLDALGVYQPHVPEYTSAIFVELLEDETEYYVSIWYYLGIPPIRTRITVPGCAKLCPLEKFVELYSNVLPTQNDMVC
ncbi:venom acid phosphatase Acph-1 [Diachasma alloeum]|uniref:venom acid phosphatase Acph-1 n=1 Tax=Diachasma alloeum TaxID=454923 RepID=UPI00073846FC|nr:venom acid phosphatase Acph-1 [Diachasma alloeum]